MEIKSKLFTVIAQALDKLKKQFDNTDKSLAKTQTTLDATIVNIDNVVDSVARTMTEALDPYFVDMIYGYIDDNGKFKLGVIKDPWKDIDTENARIADIIPINTKYIYHWGDKDVLNNINKVINLLYQHTDFIGDIDISLLFPNAYLKENHSPIISWSKLNKLTINTSHLYQNAYCVVNDSEINNLCIIYDTLDNTKSASFGRNCKIHNLELVGMKLLPRNLFMYCEFTFESTRDIVGWDDIESIEGPAFEFASNKCVIKEFYIGSNIKQIGGLEIYNLERLILEGSDKTINIITHPIYGIKELYIDSIDNYMTYNGKSPLNYLVEYNYADYRVKIYENNTELTTLTIPNNTSVITEWKFAGFSVDKIILPDNLTKIEHCAFMNRGAFTLQEIHVPSIDIFLNALFKGMTLSKYWLYYMRYSELDDEIIKTCQSTPNWSIIDKTTNTKIREITIPDSTYQLGDCCFYKCDIETVNCNDLTTIGDCAFAFSNLTTIICDNVSSIGTKAFAFSNLKSLKVLNWGNVDLSAINNCHLDYMVISNSYKSILHNFATENDGIICDRLYINSQVVKSLSTDLNYIGKVYVPSNVVNTFKNKWSQIADKIFPYDFELNPDNI